MRRVQTHARITWLSAPESAFNSMFCIGSLSCLWGCLLFEHHSVRWNRNHENTSQHVRTGQYGEERYENTEFQTKVADIFEHKLKDDSWVVRYRRYVPRSVLKLRHFLFLLRGPLPSASNRDRWTVTVHTAERTVCRNSWPVASLFSAEARRLPSSADGRCCQWRVLLCFRTSLRRALACARTCVLNRLRSHAGLGRAQVDRRVARRDQAGRLRTRGTGCPPAGRALVVLAAAAQRSCGILRRRCLNLWLPGVGSISRLIWNPGGSLSHEPDPRGHHLDWDLSTGSSSTGTGSPSATSTGASSTVATSAVRVPAKFHPCIFRLLFYGVEALRRNDVLYHQLFRSQPSELFDATFVLINTSNVEIHSENQKHSAA